MVTQHKRKRLTLRIGKQGLTYVRAFHLLYIKSTLRLNQKKEELIEITTKIRNIWPSIYYLSKQKPTDYRKKKLLDGSIKEITHQCHYLIFHLPLHLILDNPFLLFFTASLVVALAVAA
jgi:hypothetical protein